ncbi:hypothetical protein IST4116A_01201 [Burkholderia cenocepacia]|uniref:hypothetical protein n=1 Tax=Burkholderia cenocepacia TaxID=95486 RepID=UPI00199A846E|nr:hypothetical protein [Burkholderia cenocepacia]CAB5082909.1 hypothetical protein IST4116B_01193 [Burkholderia cenocepacia]CAB5083595.1 hypothetical protein IST4134_01202 [Burkholderia cenocepacia]CAB5087722.1 hypothetical protein IST4113_01200 [Burkholderia cenocepacia]CAB5095724.1 hypothetical protein IST439_01240 [Burkholderia cenocepacia]CAB5105121.1 hypothetical protein IST4129_01201 [Burkholderia cenocepacia]
MGIAVLAGSALAMTAVSTAMSAYGASRQAAATASADQYQAEVARINQRLSGQYAQQAIDDGENKVAAKQQQTSGLIGAQRAAMAANGVQLDSGTPLRLQEDSAQLGAVDALTIRNNAAREAYGYQVQGLSYGQQAQLDEASASNALSAGSLNTFSSILGGAASVGSKWIDYKKGGIF